MVSVLFWVCTWYGTPFMILIAEAEHAVLHKDAPGHTWARDYLTLCTGTCPWDKISLLICCIMHILWAFLPGLVMQSGLAPDHWMYLQVQNLMGQCVLAPFAWPHFHCFCIAVPIKKKVCDPWWQEGISKMMLYLWPPVTALGV